MIALWAPSAHAGWTPPVRISDESPSYGPRIVANGDIVHVAYWRGGIYLHLLSAFGRRWGFLERTIPFSGYNLHV